jgi:hypothetical protein
VLGRAPDAEEAATFVSAWAGPPKDRQAALRNAAWALLASSEFRFNH